MPKNIIFIYVILFLVFIGNCDNPKKPQPITASFLGQTAPGVIPIRFASEIITDNFYPHSRMIISPQEDSMFI